MLMNVTQAYEVTVGTTAMRVALPSKTRDSSGNGATEHSVDGDTIAVLRSSGAQLYCAFDRDPTTTDFDFICLGSMVATYTSIPPHAEFVSYLASAGSNLVTVNVGQWIR